MPPILLAPCFFAVMGALPDRWFTEPILPLEEARNEVAHFVDAQLVPIPLPENLAQWEERKEAIRAALLEATGLRGVWPPAWPLNVRVKDILERDGYRIEKLTYESWPGMAVPALLYVPEPQPAGGAPGIVSISGHHYQASKAADYVQARNVNLVKRGYIVLSYDYMNCFERNTGGDGDGHDPVPKGGGNDHGISAFSYSDRCATTLEILDARRALDVLAARAEVDAHRLAFTGESGGSNSTYWVAALDDRVALAVPVCSVSTFDYWIKNDRNWDWHQRPPGARGVADIGVLLALRAPRPTLIITSKRRTDDLEFPWEEAERSYQWARHVYSLYGAADKIAHIESTTGHGYQADKRLLLYEWVELLGRASGAAGDIPVTAEPREMLRVGLPDNNKTYMDVYREWVAALPAPAEPKSSADLADYVSLARAALAKRLGMPEHLTPASDEVVRQETDGDVTATFYAVTTEPGMRIPVTEFRSRAPGPVRIDLLIGERSRLRQEVASVLAAGRSALVVEPRGAGETAWGGRRSDNAAWFFGRPRTGQETFDVLRVAALWRARGNVASLSVAASERFGKVALLAVALDPKIDGLSATLRATDRARFASDGRSALADVPGLLAVGDLPQLAALVAPRRCTLKVPDPAPYGWTSVAFRAVDAGDKLRIESEPVNARNEKP